MEFFFPLISKIPPMAITPFELELLDDHIDHHYHELLSKKVISIHAN